MESVSQRDFSQIMTESIGWPFERKENFFSALIPLITIIATKKMSEISIIPSLLIAAGSFAWYRLYLNNQSSNEVIEKKSLEEKGEKYKLLASYLPLGYAEMQKVFIGFELNDKGEEINREYYFPRRRGILEACKTFNLDPDSVENIWKSFPKTAVDSQDQFDTRVRMLLDFMPNEKKEPSSGKSE
ncbi:MAG: hypothetical protein K940chlam5_00514 [Candidatus Anoxychlamydiales bacterium]|nr:hypothetical protein [Candidatus Anoxychlamydiales bacterium]